MCLKGFGGTSTTTRFQCSRSVEHKYIYVDIMCDLF